MSGVRTGCGQRIYGMTYGIHFNGMTDTSPVMAQLRDRLAVICVRGGSGSDG